MTSVQVRIKGHTEIVKMLQVLETTNQNGELYMWATLGSKGDPPTELLKNSKKNLGNVCIKIFICRYKTKMKGTLKIKK
jgi:hypothetical protein